MQTFLMLSRVVITVTTLFKELTDCLRHCQCSPACSIKNDKICDNKEIPLPSERLLPL
jgi:hypothetical protein